jgi:hypothetical protein
MYRSLCFPLEATCDGRCLPWMVEGSKLNNKKKLNALNGFLGFKLNNTTTIPSLYDCFQVRARILNPFVGVPSTQPHLLD